MGRRRAATAAVACAALAAGIAPVSTVSADVVSVSRPVTTGLERFYSQDLSWANCYGGAECAWLTVPRSYSRPGGATIRVRVVRLPAEDPSARIGSLVVNPGGPGASGVDLALSMPYRSSGDLLAAYDIVGFDPRGVDRTTPVTCLSDRLTDRWLSADNTPDSPAEERALAGIAQRMADSCRGPLLRHVGSRDTVRDMDILREALGDGRLNYLGYSYGTYLGGLYADLFPDRVGRMVLDAAVDPRLDVMELSRGQSDGFQQSLRRFADDCARRAACSLGDSRARALRTINSLLLRLDRAPLAGGGDRRLTESLAITALIGSTYDAPAGWASLRRALTRALDGDGTALLAIADSFTGRLPSGRYASSMQASFIAIGCWDSPAPPGLRGLRRHAAAFAEGTRLPEIARSMSWGNVPCTVWPEHTSESPGPVDAPGRTILVVGTTYDPATPVRWARSLARQLDAALLVWDADGHAAYGRGSRCVDRHVEDYLLTGVTEARATCSR